MSDFVQIDNKIIINEVGKTLNVDKIRMDFPLLQRLVHCKPLIYLDNAASTQKPQVVIDQAKSYYMNLNSNVHRGVHWLSQAASKEFELSREKVRKFINANSFEEVIFTRGCTESINLVAYTLGRKIINEGDEILLTQMEHHSNIVPWQILAEEKNAKVVPIPVNDKGEISLEDVKELITERTKLISIVHISNSLGTINPVREIVQMAHERGILVLIDGAQSIQHMKIDVQELDCDFYTFSGHKIYAPMGIGVLYGKKAILDNMPPFHGGGDMISSCSFEKTTFNRLPYKFEAGTPNVVGAIGLGTALDYIKKIGIDNIAEYENELLIYATEKLSQIKGLRIIGTAKNKASVISFVMDGCHAGDIGSLLDMQGIAVRTGTHCTEPVMRRFNVTATARASFSFYNTIEEIDKLYNGLLKVQKMLN